VEGKLISIPEMGMGGREKMKEKNRDEGGVKREKKKK
jgi:hypothetical protein